MSKEVWQIVIEKQNLTKQEKDKLEAKGKEIPIQNDIIFYGSDKDIEIVRKKITLYLKEITGSNTFIAMKFTDKLNKTK
jgi:hypothetical protein